MEHVFVLAQERVTLADRLFEKYPPAIAVPAYVLAVVLAGLVAEKVLVAILRRITARTKTKIDDAFAEGLPSILRPAIVLAALHVAVNVAMRVEKAEGTELTQLGRWVSTGLMVLSVLVLSFCVARLVCRMVDAWVGGEPVRVPIGQTAKFAIKVVAVPLAAFTAAEVGGARINGALTALGVGSLALGFALQDLLKNIIAGIQIVLDRPIRTGDFVELDKTTRGTVVEVGLRSTKIRSPDNNTIIIPNSTIANAIVTNVDHTDRTLLQSFEIGVAYGSDTRRVQRILEDVSEQAVKDVPGVLAEPQPVSFRDFGESSVNFTVRVRMKQFLGRGPAVTEMYHRFYERLRAEGIDIPFPTRTVHLHQDAAPTAAASRPPSSSPPPSSQLSR